MKVAVVIAHTPSGWHTLAAGSDIAAIRSAYKQIKVAGHHAVKDEAADVVYYFDSAGQLMRKNLRPAEVKAAIVKANADVAAQAAAAEAKKAEAAALADGSAKAAQVAAKALDVIAHEIAGSGVGPALAAGPVSESPAASAAVVPEVPATPAPAAPPVTPTPAAAPVSPSTEEDDTASHFGGGRRKKSGANPSA